MRDDQLKQTLAALGHRSVEETAVYTAPALSLPQLAVACPACGAAPGALCTSHGGTRPRRGDVHQARTAAHAVFVDSVEIEVTGGCGVCDTEEIELCAACGRCRCHTHERCVRPAA
ncbi:hypothetical protein OG599_35300 (plasmid) [Streptomyces sp. NBC_01335]|uniref:zinc finger domain-containing protein n=1 Tax=Streptomyces sp. NBC_01335 TaxID=2903828 RepID=UPI002E111964|nr:hypothetical protein OG599_35300 [Streptomyces sp. NBC_01335]